MQTAHDSDVNEHLDVLVSRWKVVAAAAAIAATSAALYVFTSQPIYRASALLVIEKERGSGLQGNGVIIETRNDDYYETQYRLLKSDSLLREVARRLELSRLPAYANGDHLQLLRDNVAATPIPRSRLVYVHAEMPDAALAARIANTVAETFVEQSLNYQLFISKEILRLLTLEQVDQQTRRLYESLPAVVNNPLLQTLKAEQVKLEAKIADLSAMYREKHPTMIATRSNLAALRRQVEAETEKVVTSLKAELSGKLKGNNVRVIDQASVPLKPAKPDRGKVLFLGIICGLMAGCLLALVLHALDQSVRTQEDVEKKLKLPFLALIPMTPQLPGQDRLVPEGSLAGEALRNMRTMVDFASYPRKDLPLMVVSAVKEEGKSFVASNLAAVFAHLGERVLLIDGDLRRPSLHRAFGLSTEKGLADFLAGAASLEDLTALAQATRVEGLKVIACGPKPPNPAELLNTPRVEALLAWAREHFDRVIVDCPPLMPVTDALLWGRHIKAAVMVVRSGKTRAPLTASCAARLAGSSIKTLGVAVNQARLGGFGYYSYGRYEQSYTQDDEAVAASA